MKSTSIFKHRQRLGRTLTKALSGVFTEYETPKLVLIHSLTFAILLRIMQIIILIYSILYLLLYEKGYQKQDTTVISAVTLKVKGIGYINAPNNETIVIDVADYVVPSSENNAIFLMTNFITTDQTRSTCPESTLLREAICESDLQCMNKGFSPNINGRWTGRCIFSSTTTTTTIDGLNQTKNTTKAETGLCEYSGWCPPEHDLGSLMLMQEVLNFTIFIKNFIEFPTFDVKHKNMVDNLKPCVFHEKTNKDCPIYTIGYILKEAEKNASEVELMLKFGGVIRIKIDWDCNLDRHIKACKPEYSFARLDVPFHDRPFSKGFNFRYASHWKHQTTPFRTLTKAYGLRLIITVSGKAGKFDFITLTLNIGSVVGIFGLATFLCDIILFHLSKKARVYRKFVFESVHLGTRTTSIREDPTARRRHHDAKESLTKIYEKSISSNGTIESSLKSSGKTVAMRPLTFALSDQEIPTKPV